jgi:hypothetical protein
MEMYRQTVRECSLKDLPAVAKLSNQESLPHIVRASALVLVFNLQMPAASASSRPAIDSVEKGKNGVRESEPFI